MKLTSKQARARQWKRGEIVYYATAGHAFGAVVDCEPWNLGDGRPVVNLAGLGHEYRAVCGTNRTRVNGADCEQLRLAPTECVDGRWIHPTDDSEPVALVTYAFEPSPETGHEGWCWWALGKMGDAASYEQARLAAERVIAAKLGTEAKR